MSIYMSSILALFAIISICFCIGNETGLEIQRKQSFGRNSKENEDLCPPDWIFFGDKCYNIYEGLEVNYYESLKICKAQSADLPSIISEELHTFLNKWLLSVTNVYQAWTSARRANFTYMDNTKEVGIIWFWIHNHLVEYTKWHIGHPLNDNIRNCMMLRNMYDTGRAFPDKYDWQSFYDWSSVLCTESATVICEKKACERGWLEFKGKCYKVFDSLKMTHTEAIQHCEKNKAKLISISSASEDRFLTSLLNKTCNAAFIWTSGKCSYNRYSNPAWTWQELNIKFGYTNWLQGSAPLCVQYQESCMNLQNQVSMNNDTRLNGYKWVGQPCNEKHPFVCRKQPGI